MYLHSLAIGARRSLSAVLLTTALAAAPAWAGTYTQLHAFTGGADGAVPWGQLAADVSGNLYGVTSEGGAACTSDPYYNCGVVYKMAPSGAVTTLHAFTGGAGGFSPESSLTFAGGEMFGGANGGANNAGLLFSMNGDGSNFTIFHQFAVTDGSGPVGKLQPATNGGLFGITAYGGSGHQTPGSGDGVLFFAQPSGGFNVLHNFIGGSDGKNPNDIVMDAAGNIYGSTLSGGGNCATKSGCGVIFKYTVTTKTFSILYAFQDATDGHGPLLGGIDSTGTLYGAASGGRYNHGTLFSLKPQGASYTFTLLTSLKSTTEADDPINPPTLASNGALVGATSTYLYAYEGSTLSKLATFGTAVPVKNPYGQFLLGHSTTLYGTSNAGGVTPCPFSTGQQDPGGCGTIFSYTVN